MNDPHDVVRFKQVRDRPATEKTHDDVFGDRAFTAVVLRKQAGERGLYVDDANAGLVRSAQVINDRL